MSCPLIQALWGEAKNIIISAISSGLPGRPARAIFLTTLGPNALVKSSNIPVLTAAVSYTHLTLPTN